MTPCLRCDRVGWEFFYIPTRMYRCGFYRVARICIACRGRKFIQPVEERNKAA